MTAARLVREHIRASFHIDQAVLKQLDKLVDVLENPGSLAYMVYEIEPADQPHSYREWVSEARPEDKPCCRICGRYEQGHDKKQVEVREMLGMQGAP
jgi:hypothetical protein